MTMKTFSPAMIGAGVLLALTIGLRLPVAQAKEVDASHQSTAAVSTQTLSALEARYKAQGMMARYRAEIAAVKTRSKVGSGKVHPKGPCRCPAPSAGSGSPPPGLFMGPDPDYPNPDIDTGDPNA